MNKLATELRTYVKTSQSRSYLAPVLLAATLGAGAYAFAPRSSDGPVSPLDMLELGAKRVRDHANLVGSAMATQGRNLLHGRTTLSPVDQLKLTLQVYGNAARDMGRHGSLALKEFRGELKNLGIPTYPGDKIDEFASILAAPFK